MSADRELVVDFDAPGGAALLTAELAAAVQTMKSIPWTAIDELRGKPKVIAQLEEAEHLLKNLKKSIRRRSELHQLMQSRNETGGCHSLCPHIK
jgi:hypothetical protein